MPVPIVESGGNWDGYTTGPSNKLLSLSTKSIWTLRYSDRSLTWNVPLRPLFLILNFRSGSSIEKSIERVSRATQTLVLESEPS